jgi:serine/threonine protein kinase
MQRISAESLLRPLQAAEFVVQLLDHFEYTGPNGTHLCLVLELMWQDVWGFLEGYRHDAEPEYRLPLVKRISRQLAEGLKFLHTCGVVHNGNNPQLFKLIIDFHVKNFLVGLKAATPLTVSEVLAQDKSIHTLTSDYMSLKTDNNLRVYYSQPLCGFLDGESFAVENIIIKIADFGKGM